MRLRDALLVAGLGMAVANLVIGIAQLRATNQRASGVTVNLDPEVIRAARTIAWRLTDTQSA